MHRHPAACLLLALALVVATSFTGAARQNMQLPVGKVAAGEATSDKNAVYQFTASTAGVLTVTVQGTGRPRPPHRR